MIPQPARHDDRVSCHSCVTPGRDEHGNVCPRCKGDGLRDPREAAAHVALINAREAESKALKAVRTAANVYAAARDVSVATANVRRARDKWEAELARVATSMRAEMSAAKKSGREAA